ncbi:MAG: phospholipase D-like domain-containing protein [Myxococcota bacterium]|nr:phospholipase D-like domain-containing protein [Myxococcota bacterium]
MPTFVGCAADEVLDDDGWHPADGKADEAAVPLRYQSYDVLFTNPLCADYPYATPLQTVDGSKTLTAKPKNVFCTYDDVTASAARPTSPQHKLLEWLEPLGAGDEIFLAYLSFSNAAVADKLCAAAMRGAQVTFVMDKRSAQAERIEQCGATILLRGNAGGIGYAHNKVVLINPKAAGPADADADHMKLTFSSGNMSSGVVTHHENWHFIDVARDSYFAQAHGCLMDAQLSATASAGRTPYKTALNACRGAITAPEETDIKAFFIPNRDDAKRAERYLFGAIDEAAAIDLGAHRFGHTGLVAKLATKLEAGTLTLRMVADDDLYWVDPVAGTPAQPGPNDAFEAGNVARLETAGGDGFEIRYFETNHALHLLHHNKYLLYRTSTGKAFGLIAGAANLTRAGFNDNFENIYFIKIPHVLEAFTTQFGRVWDGQQAPGDTQDPPIATPRHLMPAADVTP